MSPAEDSYSDMGWSERLQLGVLTATLLGFVGCSYYVRYVADDYGTAIYVRDHGWINFVTNEYSSWTGRFMAEALQGMAAWLGPVATRIVPAVLILGMLGAAYWSISRLLAQSLPPARKAMIALLLVVALIVCTPDRFESIYWSQAGLTYSPSVILGAILVGICFGGPAVARWPKLAVVALIAFIAAGFSETYAFMQCALLFVFWVATVKWRRVFGDARLLLALVGSTIGLIVVAVAPGNAYRESFFPAAHLLWPSLGDSLLVGLWFPIHIWSEPFMLVLLVGVASVFYTTTHRLNFHARALTPRLGLLAWIVVSFGTAASVFPSYWATGGGPADRTLLSATAVTIAGACLISAICGTWLGKQSRLSLPRRLSRVLVHAPGVAVTGTALLVLGWIVGSIPQMETYASAKDLQVQLIQARSGQQVEVPGVNSEIAGPLEYDEGEEMAQSTSCWINQEESQYYGARSVAVTSGVRNRTC